MGVWRSAALTAALLFSGLALTEMARHSAIRWIVLPGNHDSLQATELWTLLAGDAPANVTLATAAGTIALGEDAVLMPAP